LRIKKIRIFNNYRRFHDLTINLGDNPKRIIALVGPNGCGKSSVFDAMIYLNTAYSGQFGNTSHYNNHEYHFMEGFENNSHQSINIIYEGNRSFQDVIRHHIDPSGRNTAFSFRSSYRYNSILDIKETRAIESIKKNNVGASSASDIDQRMEDNYRRLIAKYRDYQEETDSKPSEAREHIIGELNKAISACIDIEIVSLGNVESGKGCLYFKKSDYESSFSFNVLSAGEKEVIDILVDLYLRKDVYNNSVFLLDEPELHINTAIQRKLLIEINKMIGANCQIWIATHSIGFLRALQEELKDDTDIIKFEEGNQWAKKPYTLIPMKKNQKNWQTLFTTALDDITALLAPKRIVYCEGRDKPAKNGAEKGFDANVYNVIFGEEFPDTLFVSSGGNTEIDQRSSIAIAIIGKALPETKIIILKDRDMGSGKLFSREDRENYLALNDDHHKILKRFEIENYLFDKSVLIEYCKNNNKIFYEHKYDALNIDIINGDIKALCNDIKNICGVVGSINAEKFKIKLAEHVVSSLPIYIELKEIIFG